MPQLTLDEAFQEGERGMARAAIASGVEFQERARQFVLDYLRQNGEATSEDITDECKRAGIKPPSGEDRAFGAVYRKLSRDGLIEWLRIVPRRKGHGVSGAKVWALTAKKGAME